MREIQPHTTDWFYCSKCQSSYLVPVPDADRHLLKKTMRCPNYRTCAGQIRERQFKPSMAAVSNAKWVTATELFQGTAGIGLPGERKCSPTEVRKLLVGSRVTSVHLEKSSDPQKSILMSLTLDSGKTIHVATSTKGAIVYKVTYGS